MITPQQTTPSHEPQTMHAPQDQHNESSTTANSDQFLTHDEHGKKNKKHSSSGQPKWVPKDDYNLPTEVGPFIASLMVVGITALLIMCLVSGRWFSQDEINNRWTETSMWGTCQCTDIHETVMCDQRERKVQANKSFSVIAAGFEFLAILVMMWYPKGTKGRVAIVFFWFMAAASLIITVAVSGNLFRDKMCNDRLKDTFHLDWAMGIRVGEFVFAVALGIASLFRRRGRKTLFLGILVLFLTVFTTTSRGWASYRTHLTPNSQAVTTEIGLWDSCVCQRTGDIGCGQVRRLMRATQAFEIISVAAAVLLTGMVISAFKAPRVCGAILGWLCFVFMILPWIFMAAIWNQTYCGARFKDVSGYSLHWGFAIQVALSGLMIPTAILLSLLNEIPQLQAPVRVTQM